MDSKDTKDYYASLGLKKGATEKELRSAFRTLARKNHPDVNPNNKEAEQRFKDINEAYEVLSDPDKRKVYDELGSHYREYEQYRSAGGTATPSEFLRATQGMGANPFAGAGARGGTRYEFRTTPFDDDIYGGSGSGSGGFSDFFQQAFGGGRGGRTRTETPFKLPGQDIEQEVGIALEEAVKGTSRTITFTDESGQRRIEATIPAGVRTGSRVRLAGQGGAGYNGGPNGDLYLNVHILPHQRFEVKESDVYVTVPVDLTTCMLGGDVLVPTPKGTRVSLKIPAETQNGRVFRLSGLGLPAMRKDGKAGNLQATVQAVLPTGLSEEERTLFKRLAELRGGHTA